MKEYIKKSNTVFHAHVQSYGGWNFYVRAVTAKILWVILLYKLAHLFTSNYGFIKIIVGWGIISFCWDKIFSKHSPQWIEEVITGEIFFGIDKDKLNKYIYMLLCVHAILFIWPLLPNSAQTLKK